MLKCNNCGTEIGDGMKFCPNCGAEIVVSSTNKICQKCGEVIEDGMMFCPNCGTRTSDDVDYSEKENSMASTNAEETYKNDSTADHAMKNSNTGDVNNNQETQEDKWKTWSKYLLIFFLCLFVYKHCGGSKGSVSDFAGTYSFSKGESRGWDYHFTVHKDGRCTLDGGAGYCGDVVPVSSTAFRISGDNAVRQYYFNIYKNGRIIGSRQQNLLYVVFDKEEQRLYFNEDDYKGRDIATPDYCEFTYSKY